MEASGRELFSLHDPLKVDELFRPEFRLGQEEGEGVAPREPGWGLWRCRRNRAGMQSRVSLLLTPLLLLRAGLPQARACLDNPGAGKHVGGVAWGGSSCRVKGKRSLRDGSALTHASPVGKPFLARC